ncbi:MAG: hypothetical protein LBQ41_01810, partial [Candidatus Ancillula sp.]|nr:hypothetical protein [Candidatus Ancillula sp.]
EDGWDSGITADKLKRGLNMFSASVQCDIHYSIHHPSQEIRELLTKLGIDSLPELCKLSDVVQLKNKFMKADYMHL